MAPHFQPPGARSRLRRHREAKPGGRSSRVKTLVVGLGNPIARDDSVGLRVASLLESMLAPRESTW